MRATNKTKKMVLLICLFGFLQISDSNYNINRYTIYKYLRGLNNALFYINRIRSRIDRGGHKMTDLLQSVPESVPNEFCEKKVFVDKGKN